MNWPNRLSLIRVLCAPLVVLLLILDGLGWTGVAALLLFLFAAATDWLDGNLARKYHLITNFGKFLDPVADKLLVLSTMAALCALGYIGAMPLVAVIFRELAVDGLRLVAVEQGRVIAAGPLGKVKTVTQMMMLISFLMLRVGWLPSAVVPNALMAIAIFMTIWSGVDYFVRNREVLHG